MNYLKIGAALIIFGICSYVGWNYYLHYTEPTIEVHEIKLPSLVSFDKQGYFLDISGAKELFKRASHMYATLPRPIAIKKMSRELQIAQFGTAQLYEVTGEDGKQYILKEIKGTTRAKKEIKRLERVQKSKRLAPYRDPKVKNNLQIIVPLAYVSYTHKGKKHIFTIMRKARGILLQQLMEKFRSNPHDKTIQRTHVQAYSTLGGVLADFYRTHGSLHKTIAHQDPHSGNIFYFDDGVSRVITLIDNEHMACSLDELRSISIDLGHLFTTSPFVVQWAQSDFLEKFDAKKWYSIVVPNFILGFMQRYPENERVALFKELKELMLAWDPKVKSDTSKYMRGLIKEQLHLLEQQLIIEHKSVLPKAPYNNVSDLRSD